MFADTISVSDPRGMFGPVDPIGSDQKKIVRNSLLCILEVWVWEPEELFALNAFSFS